MKKLILLILISALISCSTTPPIKSAQTIYGESNFPLVETGQMKWSDYYIGLYESIASQPNYTTGDILKVIDSQIDAAKDYEGNKITKEAFESKRRKARAELYRIDSEYELKMQTIEASNAKQPEPEPYKYKYKYKPIEYDYQLTTQKRPITTRCNTYGNNTTCTTD